MLDIRFIRENAELVAEKSKQKGYDVDIQEFLRLDKIRNEKLRTREDLKTKLNSISNNGPLAPEQLAEAKSIKEKLSVARDEFKKADDAQFAMWKTIPNMPADDVPVGTSENDNIVAREWGNKPSFNFEPKTHWEIGESRGWIDKERAAKVAGSRFAYLKGDLVKLQFALIQFVLDTLTNEESLKKIIQEAGMQNVSPKAFVPVLPPLMVRTGVFDAMDRLEPKEERYKVGSDEDNLWLQGSAEHTLGPMHMDEILDPRELPIRYLGYATSFRHEAGTYGKDTEGIIRMHQFDKLEMESFTSIEDGMNEHLFMVAIQGYLLEQLNIPYRVIQKCTADIGKPNARGIDLDAWLPGNGRYLETHTADYMTDYQARRLKTRVKDGDFACTNDATALALGRGMVAIIENYQTADGKVNIPEALQPYMHGQTHL